LKIDQTEFQNASGSHVFLTKWNEIRIVCKRPSPDILAKLVKIKAVSEKTKMWKLSRQMMDGCKVMKHDYLFKRQGALPCSFLKLHPMLRWVQFQNDFQSFIPWCIQV